MSDTRDVTDYESVGFRHFHKPEPVGFADPFSIGFGFDFRFGLIRSLVELIQK